MAQDDDEFERQINNIINKVIPDAIAVVVRRTAFAIDQAVVMSTPVGNPTLWKNPNSAPPGYVGGHARRNWITTIGDPSVVEIEGVDQSGSATLDEAARVIGQYTVDDALQGIPIYISNNVPYISPLNNGWSMQAPSGFVEKAVQAGVAAGRGARLR